MPYGGPLILSGRRALYASSSTAVGELKKHYYRKFFLSLVKNVLPLCMARKEEISLGRENYGRLRVPICILTTS